MSALSTVIARVELGEVRERRVVEAPVEEAVRNLLFEVLGLWNPKESDLVVTRERLSSIKPELVERYGDIGVYVVSYDIEWRGDVVVDKRFFVIVEDLGTATDEIISELAELSREALSELEKELKSL